MRHSKYSQSVIVRGVCNVWIFVVPFVGYWQKIVYSAVVAAVAHRMFSELG